MSDEEAPTQHEHESGRLTHLADKSSADQDQDRSINELKRFPDSLMCRWRWRSSRWFSWSTITELGLLIAAIVYATFTYGLLDSTRKALEESRKQTRIQADGLRLTHRPWLELHITVAEPLTFYDTYAQVVLNITIRNGGTAPAIRTTPMLGLTITGVSDPHADDANRILCAPSAVKTQLAGISSGSALILPNSEAVAPRWGLQRNPPWKLSPDGKVFASISGCIAYLDEIGEPHATFVALTVAGNFEPANGIIDRQWLQMPFVPAAY